MSDYQQPNSKLWKGRLSKKGLYLHEAVGFLNLDEGLNPQKSGTSFAILGYACDEGIKRNGGRIGAIEGPDAIRAQLAKLPNHLTEGCEIFDAGTVGCLDEDLASTQKHLAKKVTLLLDTGYFPLLLGGGHDIAYGHYQGIKSHLGNKKKIGIINFDAHLDLRSNQSGNNSGTPFYQIAKEAQQEKNTFHYLCLGIRRDANDSELYKTANEFRAHYIELSLFNISNADFVRRQVKSFIESVDSIYLTIDMDGFSSAYSPGVSAASPLGFSPEMVMKVLQTIIVSGKVMSMDIAETNPRFDRDNQTAKLAASLLHFISTEIALL